MISQYTSSLRSTYPTLENIPPELRYQILTFLNLEELHALVHASPVFHQDYLRNRKSLLRECLETTLHSVVVDARFAYKTGLAGFLDKRSVQNVTQMVKDYQDQRHSSSYSAESEIIDIVMFYFSVIKPLTRRYTEWTLSNLAQETNSKQIYGPLSRTEGTRVLRAFYRFQLFCNLFGVVNHKSLQPNRSDFTSIDILRIFIGLFEPWEVEEIASIYAFSKEHYDKILHDIHWDLHEKNPKFDNQRPPTPEGAFDLDNSCKLASPSGSFSMIN